MSTKTPQFGRRRRVSFYCSTLSNRYYRALLALSLAALIFAAPFSFIVSAREVSRQNKAAANAGSLSFHNHEGVEEAYAKTQTSDVDSFIIEMFNGVARCRTATPAEVPLTLPRPDDRGIPVKRSPANPPGERATAQGGENINTPLTINLVSLSQLNSDPNKDAIIAAFQKAAALWTARIKSPTTVTLNIDFGPNPPGSNNPFGAGVLGSTGSQRTLIDYPGFLTNLKASSNGSAEETAIYNALPGSFVPTDTGNGAVVSVSRTLARSLGIPVAATPTADATIGFNSAFSFDFNPDDGIIASQTDFVAVAAHEIGHALGFTSGSGGGGASIVSAWDVFRFNPGTTAGTFASANRIMSQGGTQVYYTGQTFPIFSRPTRTSPAFQTGTTTEPGLSTGGPSGTGGDGNQSSHWKADEQTQVFVGIMDPTIGSGVRETPTENDYSALETMGWDLTGNAVIPPAPPPPPAPSNDNFASAATLAGCSGNTTGTNVGATKEAGEPNNPDSPSSTRSVWYQWTAPSTGSVNIDTIGSGFDTVLAVYTGNSLGGLTLVTNNDDNEDPATTEHEVTSLVTFNATQGTVYRINLNGFNNAGSGGDTGSIKLNWNQSNCTVAPAPATLSLSANAYNISEGDTGGALLVTVNRTGDTAAAVSVDYSTSDLSGLTPCQTNVTTFASDRCDYASAAGTVRFAAGDSAPKTIQVPIINDAYVEPLVETFTITLRNAQGASLGTSTATLVIQDDDGQAATTNPINSQAFFIKQQYIDFLGRIAEPAGFAFWMDRMTNCPVGQICDRADTAKRFFESDEFKERGFYVYKLYDALLGRFPLYASEFVPEVARLNGPQTVTEQRLGKDAYLLDFMNKTEFRNLYDQYLTADHLHARDAGSAAAFIDALCAKAGVTPASKGQLTANLQNGSRDAAHTIEDFILTSEINGDGTKFYDRARIVMQYFGFLRRDPEAAGFDFWWNRVGTPTSPQYHDYRELVNNFLRSDEYNFRFAFIPAP